MWLLDLGGRGLVAGGQVRSEGLAQALATQEVKGEALVSENVELMVKNTELTGQRDQAVAQAQAWHHRAQQAESTAADLQVGGGREGGSSHSLTGLGH